MVTGTASGGAKAPTRPGRLAAPSPLSVHGGISAVRPRQHEWEAAVQAPPRGRRDRTGSYPCPALLRGQLVPLHTLAGRQDDGCGEPSAAATTGRPRRLSAASRAPRLRRPDICAPPRVLSGTCWCPWPQGLPAAAATVEDVFPEPGAYERTIVGGLGPRATAEPGFSRPVSVQRVVPVSFPAQRGRRINRGRIPAPDDEWTRAGVEPAT